MDDVLIVGAGPVGLTLACEACRHGLEPRIIDQRAEPSIHSKAQIIHARTLEVLDDMGIVDQFLAHGVPINSVAVYHDRGAKRLANLVVGGFESNYQGVLSISQHDTEVLLANHLREAYGVEVERNRRLETFVQHDDEVAATVVDENGGASSRITAAYLAGCDGAHSTTRKVLQLPFEGERYRLNIIQTDARVDFPHPVHPDEILAFVGRGRVIGLFPLPGGEHRYRFLIPLDHDEDANPTLQDFQDALDEVAPPGSTISDPKWIVGFRIHCRLASKFRLRRVFLAGDAGHIHSPAGGQGMNMGMQDAYNLAWKLGLAARGRGTEALLESYATERHQVAAATLDWTDAATKQGLANLRLQSEVAIGIRNRVASFVTSLALVQHRAARLLSMLDVGYDNSPICGESRTSVLGANLLGSADSEAPSVRSWLSFGAGPAPGRRAPDVRLHDADDSLRIFDLLRGPTHKLLLFDGAAPTTAGYEGFAEIDQAVRSRFPDLVTTHVIVPSGERPAALSFCPGNTGSVILDAAGSYHAAYGARTECLYLVRPDGYVGYRSQPADREGLLAHLRLVFG